MSSRPLVREKGGVYVVQWTMQVYPTIERSEPTMIPTTFALQQ